LKFDLGFTCFLSALSPERLVFQRFELYSLIYLKMELVVGEINKMIFVIRISSKAF